MGFEVAIYNNECDDGSKVIDSVKAAYLYADSVRVYDFLTPDFYILMESLIKEELMYKEWAEKNKRFIRQIFKSVGHGHVQIALFAEFFRKFTDDDFIMLSKFFDRLGSDKDLPDIEILFRKARAAESNRIKKNEEYSRSMYLMALRKMGVLLIQPDICGTSSFVRHQLENFSDRFIEDVGFKLFNSNPEGLSNQVNLPAIISSPFLSEYAISSLPGFEEATIDEIIDLKKELEKYIVPYRSAILKMANSIKDISDTESLQRECAVLYLQEIEPKVKEINAAVRDNNVFKNILKSIVNEKDAWAIGTSAVVAGISTTGSIVNAVSASTIAALAGLSIANGITKTLEEKKNIQNNEMYFLYESGKKMAEQQQKKKDFYMYYD